MPTHEPLHLDLADRESLTEPHPLEETLLTFERANIDPAFTIHDIDVALAQAAMEMAQTHEGYSDWQIVSRALYEPGQAAYERIMSRKADEVDEQAAAEPDHAKLGSKSYHKPAYQGAEKHFLKYHPDFAATIEAFDNPDALDTPEEITALIIESSWRAVSLFKRFGNQEANLRQAQQVILAHAAVARERVFAKTDEEQHEPALPNLDEIDSDPSFYSYVWQGRPYYSDLQLLNAISPTLADMVEDFSFLDYAILKSEEEIKHWAVKCTVEAAIEFKDPKELSTIKHIIYTRAARANKQLKVIQERQQDSNPDTIADLESPTMQETRESDPLIRAYDAALEQADRTRKLINEEKNPPEPESELSEEIRYWLMEHLTAWLEELKAADAKKATATSDSADTSSTPRKSTQHKHQN